MPMACGGCGHPHATRSASRLTSAAVEDMQGCLASGAPPVLTPLVCKYVQRLNDAFLFLLNLIAINVLPRRCAINQRVDLANPKI